MTTELHDELIDLLTTAGAECANARAHFNGCPSCQAEYARLAPLLATVREPRIQGAPGPSFLNRLKQQAAGPERLTFFAEQVATFYDLAIEQARELLLRAGEEHPWSPGPSPGVAVIPVQAGPHAANAHARLVKVSPGYYFPHPEQLGTGRLLVLEGGLRDSGGQEVWRGEEHALAPGTTHRFQSIGKLPCICAALTAGR